MSEAPPPDGDSKECAFGVAASGTEARPGGVRDRAIRDLPARSCQTDGFGAPEHGLLGLLRRLAAAAVRA
jgi:hypothetical protein